MIDDVLLYTIMTMGVYIYIIYYILYIIYYILYIYIYIWICLFLKDLETSVIQGHFGHRKFSLASFQQISKAARHLQSPFHVLENKS